MDKLDILKQMVGENPSSASAWYLLGTEHLSSGNVSAAFLAFAEAIKYSEGELQAKVFAELAKIQSGQQKNAENTGVIYEDNGADKDAEDEHDVASERSDGTSRVPLRVIPGKQPGQLIDLSERREPQVNFCDVGGLDALKDKIRMKIIKPFTNQVLFARFRKKTGGGILLYGPPGCGKTFIAKATAGECQARFIPVHITDILDPYLGVSEQNLRDIFSTARADKPSVLFLDELDAIGFHRGKSNSHHLRPIVDQLLTEMEGIDTSTDKLLVIGATNMPWDVDPAFKRPGRFDQMIFVPPPDASARMQIFKLKLADRPCAEMDLVKLAKLTELYSGADIENLVEIATEMVLAEIMRTDQERPLMMEDLLEVIQTTKPSTLEWLRTVKNYVKYANQGGLYDEVEKYLALHKKI